MLVGLLCLVPLLLSAGRATYCCALAGPCCLVLAVLCTAVHVFFFFFFVCWPMLLALSAGCVLC